jgi:hypothetical protein
MAEGQPEAAMFIDIVSSAVRGIVAAVDFVAADSIKVLMGIPR